MDVARPNPLEVVSLEQQTEMVHWFIGLRGRARLVVLVGDVGGRWSEETRPFMTQWRRPSRGRNFLFLRRRAEQAWVMTVHSVMRCSKSPCVSLVEFRGGFGLLDAVDPRGGGLG